MYVTSGDPHTSKGCPEESGKIRQEQNSLQAITRCRNLRWTGPGQEQEVLQSRGASNRSGAVQVERYGNGWSAKAKGVATASAAMGTNIMALALALATAITIALAISGFGHGYDHGRFCFPNK